MVARLSMAFNSQTHLTRLEQWEHHWKPNHSLQVCGSIQLNEWFLSWNIKSLFNMKGTHWNQLFTPIMKTTLVLNYISNVLTISLCRQDKVIPSYLQFKMSNSHLMESVYFYLIGISYFLGCYKNNTKRTFLIKFRMQFSFPIFKQEQKFPSIVFLSLLEIAMMHYPATHSIFSRHALISLERHPYQIGFIDFMH